MNKKLMRARAARNRGMAAWEYELLRATNSKTPSKAKIREVRRLRISEAARRHGMTYDQFIRAVREYDPMIGSAGFLGEQTPDMLDRTAKAVKDLSTRVAH